MYLASKQLYKKFLNNNNNSSSSNSACNYHLIINTSIKDKWLKFINNLKEKNELMPFYLDQLKRNLKLIEGKENLHACFFSLEMNTTNRSDPSASAVPLAHNFLQSK